ncbi:MAG: hypothetical protein WD153_00080 [Candidatus Paceibacterota bacterium]
MNCQGNCPNLTVNASGGLAGLPSSDGYRQYGPVSANRVGSESSRIHMLDGGNSTPTHKAKVKNVSSKPTWYAWWAKRTNVSRADLADAFDADDKRLLRVPTSTFVQSIGSRGIPIPQDEKAFAEFIRSSDRVKEVDCTAKLLNEYNMSRSSKDGRTVDMDWSRKSCYKSEKFLVYVHDDKSEQAFLSLGCGNILTPKKEKLTYNLPDISAPSTGAGTFTLTSAPSSGRGGCLREENGAFMEFAREKLGEEVVLITHCVIKPVGPAEGLSWTASDRRKYGVAARWSSLVSNGVLVEEKTRSAYRLSEMEVALGERVRFVTLATRALFEVEATSDGVLEIPSNLVTSPDGRTVIAYPRRIVNKESVMKWQTEGVSICYPSNGDDNYTRGRGPKNGQPSELFNAVAGGKNFTINFSVACAGET